MLLEERLSAQRKIPACICDPEQKNQPIIILTTRPESPGSRAVLAALIGHGQVARSKFPSLWRNRVFSSKAETAGPRIRIGPLAPNNHVWMHSVRENWSRQRHRSRFHRARLDAESLDNTLLLYSVKPMSDRQAVHPLKRLLQLRSK